MRDMSAFGNKGTGGMRDLTGNAVHHFLSCVFIAVALQYEKRTSDLLKEVANIESGEPWIEPDFRPAVKCGFRITVVT